MTTDTGQYYQPLLSVKIGGEERASLVHEMGIQSDLRGKSDTCVVVLSNQRLEINRGDALQIKWGYRGGDLTEIFRGVVRDSSESDPLTVLGIDYNTILNQQRISQTFQSETASGIVKAIMAGTGLGLEIEECAVEIARLPFPYTTLRECLDTVAAIVKKETDEEYFEYIREGIFHWGRKNLTQSSVFSILTGVNIISWHKKENGLSELFTLLTPVRHSQIVSIDGENYFVEKAEYLWMRGGRTRLGVHLC